MNYAVVIYVLGWVINIEAAFMGIPAITGLIYHEQEGMAFLITMACMFLVGIPIVILKPKNTDFYIREGFATVGLCWIVMSLLGAIPFVINKDIPNYIDALFETVSGFTTTGASNLTDIEALSYSSLMWRSFTHWIGGMGVLVFLLAIVPMTGGSSMNLMKAESPGPSVEKMVPRTKSTSLYLYGMYLTLTVAMFIFLLFGRMSVYESLTTAFGTAGTGGFAIHNSGFAEKTPYIQWVVTVFMILFGVNFSVYFLILTKKFKQAVFHEEARIYLLIITIATAVIAYNIRDYFESLADVIRHSAFQVAAIITTTGFSTTDFDQWPVLSKTILVMLMFCGACAGSTGGGMKVSRFILWVKTVFKELTTYLHPRSVKKVMIDKKPVEHEVIRLANVYLALFILIFVTSLLAISIEGYDMTTNFTSVATCINNIGPGLNLTGPTCNFAFFKPGTKIVLMIDMLAGRLELFPIVILFIPNLWKPKKKVRKETV